MAALDAAIAFVEVEDVTVLVGDDLDFDVLGAADEALEEDGVVAEGGTGFAAGFFEFALEFAGFIDNAHAAATAPEGGLDDEGEADAFGSGLGLLGGGDGFGSAGDDGDLCFFGEGAGGGFVAEGVEHLWGRTDEDDARFGAGAGQGGIF